MRHPRLERWTFAYGGRASGHVYGDPRFTDGTEIVTSEIVFLGRENGHHVLRTRNTTYALGEMEKPRDPSAEGEMTALIAIFFGNDQEKIQLWWHTPNPLLGGQAPIAFVRRGRVERLLRIVKDWREGNMP